MKCEHGREVKVELVPRSQHCWDSGPIIFDAEGKQIDEELGCDTEDSFLIVRGCDQCRCVRVYKPLPDAKERDDYEQF